MEISLPADLEKYVAEKLRSGAIRSPDELVCAGLRALISREERLVVLKSEISLGLEQSARGESTEIDIEAVIRDARKEFEVESAN